MKEKMLQVKEFVAAHKKQIIIGAGAAVVAVIGGKALIKKLQAVEIGEETVEEITGGVIEEVANTEEA